MIIHQKQRGWCEDEGWVGWKVNRSKRLCAREGLGNGVFQAFKRWITIA